MEITRELNKKVSSILLLQDKHIVTIFFNIIILVSSIMF